MTNTALLEICRLLTTKSPGLDIRVALLKGDIRVSRGIARGLRKFRMLFDTPGLKEPNGRAPQKLYRSRV